MGGRSAWSGYVEERDHYADGASKIKYQTVAEWIEYVKPGWLVDLGSNTGEFSLLATKLGGKAVAVDSDHDCIETLFANNPRNHSLYPVLANLSDICKGRGWRGEEFPGLMQRLEGLADMVLLLAITHHLAIGEGIALEEIADMVTAITKSYLIIEYIDVSDPLVGLLAGQRNRTVREFAISNQKAALARQFETLREFQIPGTARTLALLRKHQ